MKNDKSRIFKQSIKPRLKDHSTVPSSPQQADGYLGKVRDKLVSPILMWIIVLSGVFVWVQLFPGARLIPENMFTPYLIIPAALYWLVFFFGAVKVNKQAGRSVSAVDHLIKEGVYSLVRHPIYSADIVLAWGIFFFIPTVRILACVLWLTVVLVFWMKIEEDTLLRKFGKQYEEYKKNVAMVVPLLKR